MAGRDGTRPVLTVALGKVGGWDTAGGVAAEMASLLGLGPDDVEAESPDVADDGWLRVRVLPGPRVVTARLAGPRPEADLWADLTDGSVRGLARLLAGVAHVRLDEPWCSASSALVVVDLDTEGDDDDDVGVMRWLWDIHCSDALTRRSWPVGQTRTMAELTAPGAGDGPAMATVATDSGLVASVEWWSGEGWSIWTGTVGLDASGRPVLAPSDAGCVLWGCATLAGVLAHVVGLGPDVRVTCVSEDARSLAPDPGDHGWPAYAAQVTAGAATAAGLGRS